MLILTLICVDGLNQPTLWPSEKNPCTLGSYSTSTSYTEYYQVRLSSVLTHSHLPNIKQHEGNPRGRTKAGCPIRQPATIIPGAKPATCAPSKPRRTHTPALPTCSHTAAREARATALHGLFLPQKRWGETKRLSLPCHCPTPLISPQERPRPCQKAAAGSCPANASNRTPQPQKRSTFKLKSLHTFKGKTTQKATTVWKKGHEPSNEVSQHI